MKNKVIPNLIFLAGIIFIFIISLVSFKGPDPVEIKDSDQEFSAHSALHHLRIIAQKPHSMATTEHKVVRDYLVNYLKEMGLETSVQKATVVNDQRNVRAATVYNVVGVLRGTNNSKAVMIVSHYDSTPHTLGAADDGAGVSAMMETIRVIKEMGPIKNDVIFLFTDGEESGLWGARAFVNENELAKEVGVLLNLEARGSSGPAFTYEVSPDNGWLMREYFKAVRYPIASSLAYEVYKLMPNSSDFTIFKEAGMSGINVAFLEDFVNYHSMNDSPETISLRSLQHTGSYAVDMIKHFGNIELVDQKKQDLLYFNVMGHYSIYFPQNLSLFLILVSVILFVAVYVLALKRGRITVLKSLLSILIFLVAIAAAIGAVWFLNKGVLNKYPLYASYYSSNFYNALYYLVAYLAIALAVFSFIYALFYKKVGVLNMLVAILFVNLLALIATYVYMPTAIYVSLVPLIFISSALLIIILFNLSLKQNRTLFLFLNLIVLIPVIGFYLPMVKILFVTFSLDFPIASIALWLVLLGLLLIPFRVFFDVNRWLLSIGAVLVGVIALWGAHQDSNYSEEQPLQSSIFYAADHENEKAVWVSNVMNTDEWNKQFFDAELRGPLTEIYPYAQRQRLKNEAPYVSYTVPEILIVEDTVWDSGRIFTFNLKSGIDAENFQLYISNKAELKSFKINGIPVKDNLFYTKPFNDHYILDYFGWPEEGVNFTLECNSNQAIEILIFEKKLGLPLELGFKPMPAFVIPQTGYDSYLRLIKSIFEI